MKVQINKILRITAGRFHCWCDSNVGVIRKPTNAISDFLWDVFLGKKLKTIIKKELKWYQKFWNWIKNLFTKK